MPEATPRVGKPTVAEAVAFLLKNDRVEYRRACLQDWRERYGDEFAETVRLKVEAAWRSR